MGVAALTQLNKPIHGFVYSKGEKFGVLECYQWGCEVYLSERRCGQQIRDTNCGSWPTAYRILEQASQLLREQGWVLTALRSL